MRVVDAGASTIPRQSLEWVECPVGSHGLWLAASIASGQQRSSTEQIRAYGKRGSINPNQGGASGWGRDMAVYAMPAPCAGEQARA